MHSYMAEDTTRRNKKRKFVTWSVIILITITSIIGFHYWKKNNIVEKSTPIIGKAVVIKVEGMIDKQWAIDVEKQGKKSDISLIILWVDSPGGYVSDAILFSHDLEKVRKRIGKPIYVYTEYLLASGAYWITCSMDSLFASPAAYIGGIGAFAVRKDITEMDKKDGVAYFYFYGGQYKLWGNPHVKMTPEEMVGYYQRIQGIYQTFVLRVMWARIGIFRSILIENNIDTSFDNMLQYTISHATGELFNPIEAQNRGLIDRVTFFDDLCDDLRERGYIVVNEQGKIIDHFYKENY